MVGAPIEVALRDAKQQFAEYVRAVEAGESFVITRRGRPVTRLAPLISDRSGRSI